jgi:hypothetical protein
MDTVFGIFLKIRDLYEACVPIPSENLWANFQAGFAIGTGASVDDRNLHLPGNARPISLAISTGFICRFFLSLD